MINNYNPYDLAARNIHMEYQSMDDFNTPSNSRNVTINRGVDTNRPGNLPPIMMQHGKQLSRHPTEYDFESEEESTEEQLSHEPFLVAPPGRSVSVTGPYTAANERRERIPVSKLLFLSLYNGQLSNIIALLGYFWSNYFEQHHPLSCRK